MRGLAGEKLPEELWNWPKRKTSAWLVRCVWKAELRAREPRPVHGSCVSQESLGREGYSSEGYSARPSGPDAATRHQAQKGNCSVRKSVGLDSRNARKMPANRLLPAWTLGA